MHIGIAATAFGFGPASKAWALAQELQARNINLTVFGDATSAAFFERNGCAHETLNPAHPDDHAAIDAHLRTLDGFVAVLGRAWLRHINGRLPTVYVDSLGYMWDQSFFELNPAIRLADAYCAQDVFGAAGRIASFGVAHVHAVGAILSGPTPPAASRTERPSIQLGGLMNTMSGMSGVAYAAWVLAALAPTLDLQHTPVFTSPAGVEHLHASHVPLAQSAPNDALQADCLRRRCVVTSPGLTTLLELERSDTPAAFLPPQNMSQAITLQELRKCGAPHATVALLADAYPIERNVPEEEGVAVIIERNEAFAEDPQFHAALRAAVASDVEAQYAMPRLATSYDGVSQSCDIIEATCR